MDVSQGAIASVPPGGGEQEKQGACSRLRTEGEKGMSTEAELTSGTFCWGPFCAGCLREDLGDVRIYSVRL